MRRWRVGARWYAVALLTAPLVFTAVLIPLWLISPVFRLGIFASDAKVSFVLMNIVVALIVGIFEELGWTGFAVPTLLRLRYSVLATGLIVGCYGERGICFFRTSGQASLSQEGSRRLSSRSCGA
jgi:uncharacterized protein